MLWLPGREPSSGLCCGHFCGNLRPSLLTTSLKFICTTRKEVWLFAWIEYYCWVESSWGTSCCRNGAGICFRDLKSLVACLNADQFWRRGTVTWTVQNASCCLLLNSALRQGPRQTSSMPWQSNCRLYEPLTEGLFQQDFGLHWKVFVVCDYSVIPLK